METGRSFPTRKTGNSCLLPQVSGWSARHYFPSLFYLPSGGFYKASSMFNLPQHTCYCTLLYFYTGKLYHISEIKLGYKKQRRDPEKIATLCDPGAAGTWRSLGEPTGGRSAGFLSPGSWCRTSSCPEPESGWPRRACSPAQLGQRQWCHVTPLVSTLTYWTGETFDLNRENKDSFCF